MKSQKHTKLTIFTTTLVLLAVVLVACALGAARSAFDNETLEFLSTDVPLRADIEARYVFTPNCIPWWMEETPYGLEGALRTFLEHEGIIDVSRPTLPIEGVESSDRIDLRSLMLHNIDDVCYILGEQIGTNEGLGKLYTYYFENGMHVSVNENELIVSLLLEYNQADDRSQFLFDGIDGTSTYANVVARFGNNPYSIRTGPDETHVGAVNSYGYFYDWHDFVRFFFDTGGNVVAISIFFTEATVTPFVREDGSALAVHGFVGRIYYQRDTATDMPRIYFLGRGFPVSQLRNETIVGSATITQDSLRISFVVARNNIIVEQIDEPLGTVVGPWVEFEHLQGIGITEMTSHPFRFDNGHEPLHFELAEENALALAEMLRQVLEIVDDHM